MSQEQENFVPSQVGEAADLAEELWKKLHPEDEEPEDKTPVEDEDEDTLDDEDEDVEEEEDDLEMSSKELEKWKSKYYTLKGKFDAEVPRLSQTVKELTEKVKQPTSEKQEEKEDEFDEIYGAEFATRLRKVIDAEVESRLGKVTEKVESVENSQRETAQESFKSYLDDAADGWRDLWEGKDKGFTKFLQTKDPLGLQTYEEYLLQFNEKWDADGMAKIFNAYLESKGSSKDKSSLSKEQEAMVAPSRTKPTAVPTDKGKRIWTRDSISEFERDSRKGKYSDAEDQAMWADLLAAASEGRIR